MSTYQLEIEGSGARRGADEIVRSFDDIRRAADKMEGGVTASARKASSSFAELQKNVKPISAQAMDSLKQLSNIFKGFRGPSDAAVRNTIIFLQGIKSVGALNLGRVSGLASLLSTISGYKGPSATAGKNTLSLLNALRFASSYSTPRGIASFLNSLSSFKGPSAAAARNTTALLTALNSFKGGPGLAASIRALEKLTSAANAARSSLNSLKGAAPGTINIRANTSQAQGAFNKLLHSNNALQSMLLRTQTAWNALGGVLAGRAIINASNDLIKIRAQLEAATGSAQQAGIQFNYIRGFAQQMGLDFTTAAKSFGFFLGAVKGTNLTLRESRDIFAGFSTAARALQLSTADVDGVFRALGQMMSKGKIQAEELRGQLGDRLPGAFARFAVALKMTKPGELDAALKKGTISADIMKKAIIDVAQTLETEFAGSADKMSKTVDAAFNRMRNAFTFAAGDLGKSGLNEALIDIMDTMTKFIQSEALNTMLSALGKTLKFVGDNIEFFATLIGTVALSATLKWIAGLFQLGKVIAAIQAVQAANAVGNMAAAIGGATVATSNWTKAWRILTAVMKANPFIFIASAIVGLTLAMKGLTDSTQSNLDAVNTNASAMADTESIYAAYINNVLSNTSALDDETQAYIRNAQAAAMANRAKLGEANFSTKKVLAWGGGGTFLGMKLPSWAPGWKEETRVNGQRVDGRTAAAISKVTDSSGNYIPARNQTEFAQRIDLGSKLSKYNPLGSEQIAEAIRKDIALALQSDPKKLGFDPLAVSKSVVREDWTQQRASGLGISGDPMESAKKGGGGGKSPAEQWADELTRNLEQAGEALRDLEIEAQSALERMSGLLSGALDTVAAGAQGAAQAQLKTFEDSFEGAENKAKGVMALATQLQQAGRIAADADVSNYERSKAAVTDYFTSVQKLVAERSKAASVAEDVAKMRESNDVMEESMGQMNNLGRSMADVNKNREIEQQLIGVGNEMITVTIDGVEKEILVREYLYKILGKEIDRREELARANELATRRRDLADMQYVNESMRPIQESTTDQDTLDYYRELFELQRKMWNSGASNKEIQERVAVEAAIKNEELAQKRLNDEIEKGRQYGQDMADAIVNAFKDGIESGGQFLKSFKDLFKNIKSIILDFVLYNPLKQFLANALGGAMGGSTAGFGTPQTGMTTFAAPGAAGAMGAGGASIMGFAANVLLGMTGGSPSGTFPSGNSWGYDAEGYLVRTNANIPRGMPAGQDILVGAPRPPGEVFMPGVIPPPSEQNNALNYFKKIERIFDYRANGQAIKALGTAIKTGKGLSSAVGGAIGAAGNALAAYSMGNALGTGVAKALGGGFRAQAVAGGVTGGAAAGFSLGGLPGAAIGAVVGGVLGFLKKKPKLPSSYGSVSVGADGIAVSGAGKTYGKADKAIGSAMAKAGATIFNTFAREFNANLSPGKYGTFGQAEWKIPGPNNNLQSFYSLTGKMKKGKPVGKMGVDWVRGTESQVQAWALIQQVRKGMITGLSETIKTIFKNTKATDMESLNADLEVGKAYDEFISGSFKLNDAQRQIQQLNKAFSELSRRSKELGLDETKLARARKRMMDQMKNEFNFSISQGILEISNPAQAAYNALLAEYKDAVATAMAVGGDLAAVEKLYGMKRAELAKQWADIATNGLVSAAKDLLTSLKSSSASPLNVSTVFKNATTEYMGLVAQLKKGDYSNVDKLSTYTQNYLDAARNMYGSSTQYFDIFNEVTKFLESMAGITGGSGGAGGVGGAPALPKLEDIVAEINASSLEMIEEMGLVGQAVMESGNMIVDAINNLSIALGYNPTQPTAPSPSPTTPTPATGGTGGTGSGYPTTAVGGSTGSWAVKQQYLRSGVDTPSV